MFIVAQVILSWEWLSIIARSELGSDLDCSVINSRSELGSDLDCYELKPSLRSLTPSHRHMASLRRPLNRSHHSFARLLHPLVPFYRPIMHFLSLGLMPPHDSELCLTVTY